MTKRLTNQSTFDELLEAYEAKEFELDTAQARLISARAEYEAVASEMHSLNDKWGAVIARYRALTDDIPIGSAPTALQKLWSKIWR